MRQPSKALQSYQLHQSIYTKLFFCFHPSYLWVCERVVRWYSGECKSERKRHLNFFNYKFLCMITGAHFEVFNKSQGKHGILKGRMVHNVQKYLVYMHYIIPCQWTPQYLPIQFFATWAQTMTALKHCKDFIQKKSFVKSSHSKKKS